MISMVFLLAMLLHCFVVKAAGGGSSRCPVNSTDLVLQSNGEIVGTLKVDSNEATDGSELKLVFDATAPITYVYYEERLYDFLASPVNSLTIHQKLPCLGFGAQVYWVRLSVQFQGFEGTEALVNIQKSVSCRCAGVSACQEFTDYLWTDFPQTQAATVKTTSVESSNDSTVTMSIDALKSRKFKFIRVQGADTIVDKDFTTPYPTKAVITAGQVLCNTTALVPNFSEYGLKVVMYSVNLQFDDDTWARGNVPKQVLCNCLP